MNISRAIQIYIVPGAVFQSLLVGGGYGTGREVVEYFTQYGPLGGFLAISVSFALFVVVLGLTFEIARLFAVYDYRTFFQQILGRAWFIYEMIAFCMMMLVFAILATAAGTVLNDQFGIPISYGVAMMLVVVAALEYFGRDAITKVLTFWSLVLYAVFIAFLIGVFRHAPDKIAAAFSNPGVEPGWALSGFKYAMYNMTGAPIVLFAVRNFKSRGEAFGSGGMAAVIALVPAVIFHVAFSGEYPAIGDEAIPVYAMMSQYGMSLLIVLFTIMLFGTLIETGAGTLQGINERIDTFRAERHLPPLPPIGHVLVAIGLIAVSGALTNFGIAALIAKGYGTLSWGFFAVYFVPLMTVGVYRVFKAGREKT